MLTKEDVPGFIEKMRKLCEEEKAEEFWENYHANVDNINHIIKTEKELSKKEGIAIGEEKGIKKGIREGINEGKKLGKEEGISEGKAIGLREGINKERIGIIKNMLNEKLPIEKIMLYSGLSQKEVLNIKNSIINERIATVSDEKENEIFAI